MTHLAPPSYVCPNCHTTTKCDDDQPPEYCGRCGENFGPEPDTISVDGYGSNSEGS